MTDLSLRPRLTHPDPAHNLDGRPAINDATMTNPEEEADASSRAAPPARSSSELSYSEGAKLPSDAPAWAVAASERLREKREAGYISSIDVPDGVKRVLLHSCCAPCSGAMVSTEC